MAKIFSANDVYEAKASLARKRHWLDHWQARALWETFFSTTLA
jgi:hypothetical protein